MSTENVLVSEYIFRVCNLKAENLLALQKKAKHNTAPFAVVEFKGVLCFYVLLDGTFMFFFSSPACKGLYLAEL